ncbi:ChaN family lipoprotein [Flavobacterium salilacus subsp. salilacus]|uniref:ChaN family lipoprotein n=1 Tax=Flavobacterium TaxID=237 RepID=UPI0010758784|nr:MULTISPECIES: ChaN family lipoprotein [Flavobacterium]KAF2518345.1 ChaN family lipoprotein [Flavobacterium salilacus subsp. salilacus]MBE1615240.1 ChaN family lipoprotein [Flavobacterium sp. SaA2.13]
MKLYYILIAFFTITITNAQDKQPYQLYTQKGKKTTYKELLKTAAKADVVFFGEHHDNSINHWLELELTKDLSAQKGLVMGAEMIEADNQDELNQYLKGEIDQKAFDTVARLWNNYKTDYKPLVDFAKENNIPFIATNVPRRYASMVYKKGFGELDALTDEEKSWIAPLPIAYDATLPGYVKMLEMMGGHGGDNLPKAQAVKDATMGYFIAKNLQPGKVFIHYNGTYHSDNFEGINWYLKREKPEVKIITIAAVSQKDVDKLEKEHLQKADFILVIDEDMTKTY